MSPSWDRLQPLAALSELDSILDVETEPRCLPTERHQPQIRSVDSTSLADRSPGLPTATTAKRTHPGEALAAPWIPWIFDFGARYPRTSRSQVFFRLPFGSRLSTLAAAVSSGAILFSVLRFLCFLQPLPRTRGYYCSDRVRHPGDHLENPAGTGPDPHE